jgi:hypothetical protein
MWYDELNSLMPMLMLGILAACLRAAYQASQTGSQPNKVTQFEKPVAATQGLVPATLAKSEEKYPIETTDLSPQQQAWADKAIQKYAAAQKKKWQHWTESMFESK